MKKINLKVLTIALTVFAEVALILTPLFAWFTIRPKNTTVSIKGDAAVSVTPYIFKYKKATTEQDDILQEGYPVKFDKDLVGENAISNLDVSSYVEFCFVIKNESENSTRIKLRFADFSSYLFSLYDYAGTDTELSSAIKRNAMKYNAKLTLMIKNMYYYSDNIINSTTYLKEEVSSEYYHSIATTNELYLWKYGYGDYLITNENEVIIPSGESITLCFTLDTIHSNESVEEYRQWVHGEYCQNYIANNIYGKLYSNLTEAEKTKISTYLNKVVVGEVSTISKDNPNSRITLDYIEIVAEEVRNPSL